MQSAIFMVPFDPAKKLTLVLAKEWVHKSPEKENSVIIQVRDDEAVIKAMKEDPAYQWLEDVPEVADVDVKG